MKKLLLGAALLVGAVSASQAGVHFNIGIGFPIPQQVIISQPAPVYVAPCPPPVVYAPCPPPRVIVAPPPVVYYGPGYGYWHRRDYGRRYDYRYDRNGRWDNHRRY